MNRHRRGAALAELLVVMSACTVVLTMSAQLIHKTLRAQSQSRTFFDEERTAMRLSGQFRRDVQSAVGADVGTEASDGAPMLRLRFSEDQIVEYRRTPHGLVRILMTAEQPASREEFLFSSKIEIDLSKSDVPYRLVLTVSSAQTAAGVETAKHGLGLNRTSVNLQVDAVINRNATPELSPSETGDAL